MTAQTIGENNPLLEAWKSRWQDALAVWSKFTKLAEPRWCVSIDDEKREKLSDSFAMIRLTDHAVVISLRQIEERRLEKFAVEILAHEIGHHVYAPGDLRDNARLMARIRAGLPSREKFAGQISNLYTDLLINDRLCRSAKLDIAGVYKTFNTGGAADKLWTLYMRMYEALWNLPPGTLVAGKIDPQIQSDAQLGARVIRVYAKDWLGGAGRFAALCLPYLLELPEDATRVSMPSWMDTQDAGAGSEIPDGLVEIDDDELNGAIHPSEDSDITGLGEDANQVDPDKFKGGKKNKYREPSEYIELMKSVGVKLNEDEIVSRYYRERAARHLIKFPTRETPEATDPLPEGLDVWDEGHPISEIDWIETLMRSPHVIPGVTTVERIFGSSPGSTPERTPVDLYLGIDCSGSMLNPRLSLSYPVLAGTIVALSALRAGARVMAALSGEPGRFSQTDGFIRIERDILKILTGYLGTGYAFGILRLKETFIDVAKPKRPTHILVVTDSDIFAMLKEVKNGWDIARDALLRAGGGGTFVLNMNPNQWPEPTAKLKEIGWNVYFVGDWAETIAFARAFSKAKYGKDSGKKK